MASVTGSLKITKKIELKKSCKRGGLRTYCLKNDWYRGRGKRKGKRGLIGVNRFR